MHKYSIISGMKLRSKTPNSQKNASNGHICIFFYSKKYHEICRLKEKYVFRMNRRLISLGLQLNWNTNRICVQKNPHVFNGCEKGQTHFYRNVAVPILVATFDSHSENCASVLLQSADKIKYGKVLLYSQTKGVKRKCSKFIYH